MKKILYMLLVSTLIFTACGDKPNEETKEETVEEKEEIDETEETDEESVDETEVEESEKGAVALEVAGDFTLYDKSDVYQYKAENGISFEYAKTFEIVNENNPFMETMPAEARDFLLYDQSTRSNYSIYQSFVTKEFTESKNDNFNYSAIKDSEFTKDTLNGVSADEFTKDFEETYSSMGATIDSSELLNINDNIHVRIDLTNNTSDQNGATIVFYQVQFHSFHDGVYVVYTITSGSKESLNIMAEEFIEKTLKTLVIE